MLSPNGFKAIFFDLDGTLRHNLPSGGEVFANYAEQLGLRINREDRARATRWEHLYWASSQDLKADIQKFPDDGPDFWLNYGRRQLMALGASRDQAEQLAPQVHEYMNQTYHPQSVIPDDVMKTLPILSDAGYQLAVISNRSKPYQEEIEALGISKYFNFSLAGGEVNSYKPDAEIFIHACKRLNLAPAETVYVGDNYFADVVGSRRAGLQPILYDPHGIFPEAGCPVLGSFDQLIHILENL